MLSRASTPNDGNSADDGDGKEASRTTTHRRVTSRDEDSIEYREDVLLESLPIETKSCQVLSQAISVVGDLLGLP